MDDFYKQVKESLNSLPEPGFRQSHWRALSLEMRSRKLGPVAFWTWLAMPLLFVLVTMGYYQFNRHNGLSPQTLIQTDTVYITKTLTLRDTLYLPVSPAPGFDLPPQPAAATDRRVRAMQAEIADLKRQVAKTANEGRIQEEPSTALIGSSPGNAKVAITAEAGIEARPEEHVAGTNIAKSGTGAEPPTGPEVVTTRYRGYAPMEAPLLANLPGRRPDMPVEARKRGMLLEGLVEEFSEIRWNPMQLGVATALIYPSYGNGDFQIGKMIGLQALMPLTNHIQLESNLAYQNITYETDDLSETGGALPVSPSESERFLKVEAPFKAMQWDMGFNYAFNPDGRLQPKLGIAYGLVYYYQNELSYEYADVESGITWAVEGGGDYNGFQANAWLFKTGADYHLNTDWALALGGLYRAVHGTDTYQVPSYWAVGLGLRYKF